jgi:uncharacterized protein YbjT (DUF2867 family)
MILISGAGGKTGKAVLRALGGAEAVRALVHRREQIGAALEDGAVEALAVDLQDGEGLARACGGVKAVYHICPNMHPGEVDVARTLIAAAQRSGVERFVYHSVLHPQVEAMPHHWLKMRVEEQLFTSGLDFTILQPCAYMQNVLGYWRWIVEGVFPGLYSPAARISIVDLRDVAAAAAKVLLEAGHHGAIYELAGPEALNQMETAAILAQVLGREVRVEREDGGAWEARMRAGGMSDYAISTLRAMFMYYDRHGFRGNPRVLESLLGRPAVRFEGFVRDHLAEVGG